MIETTVAFAQAIREQALTQIHRAGSGHPGGSLSCADILAVLYQEILHLDQADPDTLILSKGQSCPALYAAWALKGLIPMAMLEGLRKLGQPLQGLPHPTTTPLAVTSTGSLGQGFSTAVGVALGKRHQHQSSHVYVILGDGELQEGIVWEAAMCATHYHLENLTALIDYNKLQSDAPNASIMGLEPLADKWKAFGWTVQEIDGHDHQAIRQALQKTSNGPKVIIAHTIKGKGVSWMEGAPGWHGSVKLTDDQLESALKEITSL